MSGRSEDRHGRFRGNGTRISSLEPGLAIAHHDANGQKDVLMQRMRSVFVKLCLGSVIVSLTASWCPTRGDLIRPRTARTYPDIAGDIVGTQTYTFDPTSRTGTFQVVNSPQFIALGPKGNDILSVTPNQDGTLTQTLQLKLDQNGKLVENPDNRFQLYGTVVIGNHVYRGLLLEGTPTAFGAQMLKSPSFSGEDVFDLNMKITGGKLADAFGSEAYFRVVPQSNSTFQGSFATSFSGARPLTNLRALQGRLPAAIPEPSPLAILLAAGAGIIARRWWQQAARLKAKSGHPAPVGSPRDPG
jgi:hypothetical protein